MPEPTRPYLAYLLRCWQEESTSAWRVTLEDPHSGEVIGFASLAQLFAFIERQTKPEKTPTNPDDSVSFHPQE